MKSKIASFLQKTYVKRAAWAAFFIFIFTLIAYFSFRNMLLRRAIDKIAVKLEKEHGLAFHAHNARFSGMFSVRIDSLRVEKETMALFIDSMEVKPDLWRFLTGDYGLKSFAADSISLYVNRQPKHDSIPQEKNADEKREQVVKHYLQLLHSSTGYGLKLLNKVPSRIALHSLYAKGYLGTDTVNIHLKDVSRRGRKLSFEYLDAKNDFICNTTFYSSTRELSIDGSLSSEKPVVVSRAGDFLSLKTPAFKLNIESKGEGYELQYYFSDSIITLYHHSVAKDTMFFPGYATEGKLSYNEKHLTVDENSYTRVGKFKIQQYASIDCENAFRGEVSVNIPAMPADDFFSSLPEGMFTSVRKIKAKGNIAFRAFISYDAEHEDSAKVEGGLIAEDLQLDRNSVSWITRVNGNFTHAARTSSGVERVMQVDPSSGSYVPFDRIPKHLVNAVLINEDPSFFYHHGFITEALRQSLVENMHSGSFKRGGSTISMQLIKNLYLERTKNLSRKLEEMLIVWLVENQRLLSKQKMMELYFNIIEFGPGVYGLHEAAYFYFNKPPELLDKNECIFLANIIPRPKAFRWAFNEDGSFKNWMREKASLVNRLMVLRELLPPSDTAAYSPDIQLKGPAVKLVIKSDSLNFEEINNDVEE